MTKKRGYPTPNSPATIEITTRCVPIPDIPEFIALIGGLLFQTTRASFWDELGDMTPQECADLMADTLATYDASTEGICNVDTTPIGSVVWFPSSLIPDTWFKCDGTNYLKAEYPELWSVLGTPFSTSATEFHVPNMNSKFPRGAANDAALGNTGGAASVALSVAQLPPHTHTVAVATNAGAQANAARGTLTSVGTINSGSVGASDPVPTVPPYMDGYFIIKAFS